MTALTEQGHDLVVTPQVLVEFWAVATRPLQAHGFERTCEEVRDQIDRTLERLTVIMETPAVFTEWLGLASTHEVVGKKAHDARLAALCKVENLALLSFNTPDFRRFDILVVSPDDFPPT